MFLIMSLYHYPDESRKEDPADWKLNENCLKFSNYPVLINSQLLLLHHNQGVGVTCGGRREEGGGGNPTL